MRLSYSFEKILVRTTLLALVLMVASQIVLTGSTTSMLNFRVQGSPDLYVEQEQMAIGQNIGRKSYIAFSLMDVSSLSKAFVYVNGKKRANFTEKHLTVEVYPGDFVEIDTTFYSKPVSILVEENDGQVVKIDEETVLTLKSERRALNVGNID